MVRMITERLEAEALWMHLLRTIAGTLVPGGVA